MSSSTRIVANFITYIWYEYNILYYIIYTMWVEDEIDIILHIIYIIYTCSKLWIWISCCKTLSMNAETCQTACLNVIWWGDVMGKTCQEIQHQIEIAISFDLSRGPPVCSCACSPKQDRKKAVEGLTGGDARLVNEDELEPRNLGRGIYYHDIASGAMTNYYTLQCKSFLKKHETLWCEG